VRPPTAPLCQTPTVPTTWRDLADVVIAAFIVLLTLTGVAAALSSGARRFVLDRLLGSAWYRIAAKTRAAEREHETRERLRSAIGVLSEGLAKGLHDHEVSHVKIAQSIAELRTEGPSELAEHLSRITAFVTAAESRSDWYPSQQEIDAMLSPVIEIVRPLLENGHAPLSRRGK
jgi:hypothetical protein